MPAENTDLERRVLAHEEILQALIAQLAEGQPNFLDRMRDRFASARRGAHEHNYVETADYAEAFLHEVMRLVRVQDAKPAAQSPGSTDPAGPAAKTRDGDQPVVIRTALMSGIWHVTHDDVFLGDYLTEGSARDAATKAGREIERRGGRAELVFEAAH